MVDNQTAQGLIMRQILLSLVLVSTGFPSEASEPAQQVGDRPNIIVLMAEDLSSRIGAFGDPVASTPNLDALAARGVRYPNVFTTAGVCAPSRAAHITGMYQISIGAQHMRSSTFGEASYLAVPPPEVKAYPELLRRAGYFTFTSRKLDYQFSTWAPGSGPFTIWDSETPEPQWKGKRPDQPFFGLVNLPQTHESQVFDKHVYPNRKKGLEQITNPEDVIVPPYYPDTPTVREYLARHYDNVHTMDKYAGSVLARLEADGLLDNTIILWTTDHGDGLPRSKRELYDSGIKVPMIVVWPEKYRPDWVKPGGVDEQLVSFLDLSASVLRLAGVPLPDHLHGKPVLVDKDTKREYVFAAKDRLDEHVFRERAVRDDRYKYLRNYVPDKPGATHLAYRDQQAIMRELWELSEGGKLNAQQQYWFDPRPRVELYDLQSDPHEVKNLAGDPEFADTLRRLSAAMDTWLARVGDTSDGLELEMAYRFWPDGVQPVTDLPQIRTVGNGQAVIEPATQGASIAYRVDQGKWLAYAPGAQIDVPSGSELSARSVRYGWEASDIVTQRF